MDISQKVAVITGGGSGMGAQTARHLAKLGAKVALWDVQIEAAKKIANECNGLAIECDVSSSESVERALRQTIEKFSEIHFCINCAGIISGARIVGREGPMALDVFERVIRINLTGTFNVMRLIAAQMMKQETKNSDQERGVIINTASAAAFDGQIGQAAYSASKGGIVSLTLPAAREFGAYGIRVMTIAPGLIETPMAAALPEKIETKLKESLIFPKRFGKPGEFALLVQQIFENPYLNGSVIHLDGAIRLPP